MSEYNKEVPAELRKASSTAAAEAHRDIYRPVAGPSSGSSGAFRTTSRPADAALQSHFDAFVQGAGAELAAEQKIAKNGSTSHAGDTFSRAAEIAAGSWTAEDLQPRTGDGAGVLRWLDQGDSAQEDALEQAMREVQDRQEQDWKLQADNAVPTDPVPSASDYPYLDRLLALPEGESMSAYLASNSYSDDVWGLPMTLKQDLDQIKFNQDNAAREKAVRRLDLLRRHLQGKAGSARREGEPVPSFTTEDWSQVWKASES